MSSVATIPIFDPQGTLRDVPEDQLAAAVKAGGIPAIHFQDPNGDSRLVPANRCTEAVQAGGHIQPFQQQDVQHPGLWSAMYDDLSAFAKGLATTGTKLGSEAFGIHTDLPLQIANQVADAPQAWQARQQAGHSLPYRVAAPVAGLFTNVPGMEESARTGDVGGVLGHALSGPVAMAATAGLAKTIPAVGQIASEAAESEAGQAGIAGVKAAASKLPAAGLRRIPYVGDVASDVYQAWRVAAAKSRGGALPWRDATAENVPYGGEDVEPPAAEAAPAAATPSAAVSESFPAAAPAAVPSARQMVNRLSGPLNEGLGAETPVKLQPGVTLRNQMPQPIVKDPSTGRYEFSDVLAAKQAGTQPPLTAAAPQTPVAEAPKLPEGFTPVDSSMLVGYKYHPETQELDAMHTGKGNPIYRQAGVTPDHMAALEAADSKGVAYNMIRKAPGVDPLGRVDPITGALQPRPKSWAARPGAEEPTVGVIRSE